MAFTGCTGLKYIDIPKDSQLQEIGEEAFYYNKVRSISPPSKISKIGQYAFNYSNLLIVEFDENAEIKKIDRLMFFNGKFQNIMIPKKLVDKLLEID